MKRKSLEVSVDELNTLLDELNQDEKIVDDLKNSLDEKIGIIDQKLKESIENSIEDKNRKIQSSKVEKFMDFEGLDYPPYGLSTLDKKSVRKSPKTFPEMSNNMMDDMRWLGNQEE